MVETEDNSEGGKSADTSQLPVRILDTNQNKWQHGYQPFHFPPDVTRFRLEFVCFVGDKVENLDVDVSAFLFDAKGSYVETVGYGCPASTDGGIVHKHDSVQPEAGKISEDIDFDLSMVHKRIYSACLVATTYGKNTFSALRSIQLRMLAPSHLLSDSLEREIARVVFSREGCFGRKRNGSTSPSRQSSMPNVLVLGDIRRLLSQAAAVGGDVGGGPPGVGGEPGAWNLRAPNVLASHVDTSQEVIPLVQCYLREWIPSIEVIGQELLIRRVYDIVSFLPVGDLEAMKADWVKGGTFGVTKELFLGIMLRVLLRAHVPLRDERQRLELTSLLSDLFDQISRTKSRDGAEAFTGLRSGQDVLAWEQFTTFWVEAATINTHSQAVRCWADETLQWEVDSNFELAVRKPTKLISLPLMHLVVGLEERGSYVSILNGNTGRLHVTLCPSTLQTVTTGGLNPHESFLTVLDVECIDTKGIVVISSTDHAISVWHYNHGSENAIWRCSLHSRSAQILVTWVPHERGFLVSAGVDHEVTAWCVDKQLRLAVMQGHRARVTGVTYIPQHGQFATCAFDKTVRLWDADHFSAVAEIKRRSPVKFVDARGDLVLCITLEIEAHVLSVSTRRSWCRLIGHNHLIVGGSMVHFVDARQGRQTRAITGDMRGEFFIWDIGNGQAKSGCAEVMQTFCVYTWRPNLGEIVGFERYHRHVLTGSGSNKAQSNRSEKASDSSMSHVWPDIVVRGVGGTMVVRTRQLVNDARAANVLVYNDKSMDIIASTGQHLRFWNLQTSEPLRMIASPCPQGITAMTTDKPDPKKIYLGTSEGGIAVVHIVTGQLLFEVKNAHNGAVVLVVVCSTSREVVSVGVDRRVAVHREKANGLGLVQAGEIEEAHKVMISACAVSQDAQLIATAAGGEIRLWHKQDLSFQGGISDLDADVLGLVFLPGTACLLASDSGGDVVLWVAEFSKAAGEARAGNKTAARGTRSISSSSAAPDMRGAHPALPSDVEVTARSDSRPNIHTSGARSAPAWEADEEFGGGDGDGQGGSANDDSAAKAGTGARGPDGLDGSKTGKELLSDAELSDDSEAISAVDKNNPREERSTKHTEAATASSPQAHNKVRPPPPPVAIAKRQTGSCTLRPGLLLSGRRVNQAHGSLDSEQPHIQQPQQQPSPVYEIHLHSMYDDHKPAESQQQQQNNHDSDGKPSRDTRDEGTRTTRGDGASANKTAAASGEQSTDECSESHGADRAERRTKQVIVTGSAGGWIEVWEAKGLLATAGVDEDAMAAKLQRRQPQERQGVHIRATRLRRSGLTCCTPSAASAFVGGSTKSALEALHPVPPSLRWEAHRGSPVSTLCALDKTPLVVTASTDSTIRLFSLADVQVGAQPFKAAGTLGEIDMRDTESVRIDRAEMWSCPSLTAADVRHATEIAAYRAFSKKICTEFEDQVIASSPFTPAAPSSGEPTPGGVAGENIPAASQSAARTAGRGPSHVASLVEVTEQGLPPSIADHQNAGGTTFLTAVQHEPEGGAADLGRHGDTGNQDTFCPGRGNHGRVHKTYCAPDDRFAGEFAGPVAAAPSTQLRAVTSKKNLAGGGKSGMEDRDWQKLIDGNAADLGFREPAATELGSTAAKPTRGEPAAAKADIVGHSVEGAARRGSDSLWDRVQYLSDSFDKQRMTLTSARAAKNHLGKVLYGNMYHEIKSGAACNTLVMEYVHRKNPRGDAVIDTEVSPFLKENLTDRLPSLAERRRRRRPQVNRGAKASNSANGAPALAKSTGGRDTLQPNSWSRTGGGTNTGTSSSTDEAREMLRIERSTGGGGSAGQTPGPDIAENQAQRRQALEEWHGHPHPDTGSAHGELPNRESGVNNSDDNAGNRVQRRPRYKSPVSSGPTKRNIENRAVPTDQDHTESRRSVRAMEPQHEHVASHILAAGRNRAPVKQEDAHYPSRGNQFDSSDRPVAVGRRDGRVGRRRDAEMKNDHEAPGGGTYSSSIDFRHGRRQITTSASLTTLSLEEMEQRKAYSGSRGAGEDALD
ncbi:unnamed protein product, partial [Ectocarpus sp. 13 AM-2016]